MQQPAIVAGQGRYTETDFSERRGFPQDSRFLSRSHSPHAPTGRQYAAPGGQPSLRRKVPNSRGDRAGTGARNSPFRARHMVSRTGENQSMDYSKMKIAYVIKERGDQKYWNRVGVAFVNGDGSINVRLEAVPVNGELTFATTFRAPKAPGEEKSQVVRRGRRPARHADVTSARGGNHGYRAGKRQREHSRRSSSLSAEPVRAGVWGRFEAPAPGSAWQRWFERYRKSVWAPVVTKSLGIFAGMVALASSERRRSRARERQPLPNAPVSAAPRAGGRSSSHRANDGRRAGPRRRRTPARSRTRWTRS